MNAVNPDSSGRLELIDKREACRMFGGINPAALYRGIRLKRYPRPVKVGALSRWLRAECEAALARMVADRNPA